MLGRKLTGSASFVCLRCRLQLAGAPKRLPFAALALSPSPLRPPQRYIGTYDSPNHVDGLNIEIDGDANTDHNPDPGAEPNGDAVGSQDGLADYRKSHRRQLPQKRIYKSRGQIVSPEPEGLSIDILGKPGSAIVLRETPGRKKKPKVQHHMPDDDAADAQVDPASLLVDEEAAAVSEDILLNIHELKPEGTRILTDRQFTQLKNTLVDGFTSAQLTRYVREYETIQQLSQEVDHAPEAAPWILERQPWVPTVRKAVADVDPYLEGYITKGMVPKTRLVVRLMRECWGVSNQKVLDQDGYLSIRLRDVEFSLLTLGNRRWLEGTPRTILAQVKEVKLIRETRLVSVVAPRHAAESIIDRVHEVLAKARTSDFDADLVSTKPLEPGVLEEVGRMTNTVTRLDPSGKKVVVTWIDIAERDEILENASETVLRFLRDAYGPKARVFTALAVVPDHLVHQGRYLPELNHTRKLPWQERFDKWERWTTAVSKWDAGSETQKALIPAYLLPFDLDNVKPVEEWGPERLSIDNLPGWSGEPQTDTSAVFGHVVFARQQQPASTTAPSPKPTSQLDTSLSRTFVPIIPALGSLNVPSNLREEGLWHSKVVIRFAPSPDNPPELTASAPDLELRIEADHAEVKSIVSLRAIKDTFAGDVLFPSATVDARLVQQRYYTLPGTSIDQHAPPLLTFLSKSDLRPFHGDLNTPPVLLGMPLPQRLLSPTNTTTTNPPAATTKVDYTLASIEVHRSVTAEYSSLKLRYTSIQAGERGGDRSELSLEAVRVAPQATFDADTQADAQADASDPYKVVNDLPPDEYHARIFHGSHFKNPAAAGAQELSDDAAAVLAHPISPREFLHVAAGIVNEEGRLKWHAKRS
ncbi:mitochondrial inner-membrane-bound regulator-domain-containing protein [Parachaetomium inaequale]|uniref:Mitochondrial inner-membrane-bound regulator-domain-containing protein n=1 Tax=Parachaetomium inaequale TaxID=2588326 RepID=A0AAN6PR92_9PEZI|nr:mitochondrial inner-membrane-bound regulator-domain-containing protein [Parachaetomium inaequale]